MAASAHVNVAEVTVTLVEVMNSFRPGRELLDRYCHGRVFDVLVLAGVFAVRPDGVDDLHASTAQDKRKCRSRLLRADEALISRRPSSDSMSTDRDRRCRLRRSD